LGKWDEGESPHHKWVFPYHRGRTEKATAEKLKENGPNVSKEPFLREGV